MLLKAGQYKDKDGNVFPFSNLDRDIQRHLLGEVVKSADEDFLDKIVDIVDVSEEDLEGFSKKDFTSYVEKKVRELTEGEANLKTLSLGLSLESDYASLKSKLTKDEANLMEQPIERANELLETETFEKFPPFEYQPQVVKGKVTGPIVFSETEESKEKARLIVKTDVKPNLITKTVTFNEIENLDVKGGKVAFLLSKGIRPTLERFKSKTVSGASIQIESEEEKDKAARRKKLDRAKIEDAKNQVFMRMPGATEIREEMNRLIRELDGILDSVWRAAKKYSKEESKVTLTGKDLEEYENAPKGEDGEKIREAIIYRNRPKFRENLNFYTLLNDYFVKYLIREEKKYKRKKSGAAAKIEELTDYIDELEEGSPFRGRALNDIEKDLKKFKGQKKEIYEDFKAKLQQISNADGKGKKKGLQEKLNDLYSKIKDYEYRPFLEGFKGEKPATQGGKPLPKKTMEERLEEVFDLESHKRRLKQVRNLRGINSEIEKSEPVEDEAELENKIDEDPKAYFDNPELLVAARIIRDYELYKYTFTLKKIEDKYEYKGTAERIGSLEPSVVPKSKDKAEYTRIAEEGELSAERKETFFDAINEVKYNKRSLLRELREV